jgi:WD40 repeat protein
LDESKTLVSASQDKTVRFWDIDKGAQFGLLKHDGFVMAIARQPKTTTLLTATWGGVIRQWDIKTQKFQWAIRSTYSVALVHMALTKDGQTLVTTGMSTSSIEKWTLRAKSKLLIEDSEPDDSGLRGSHGLVLFPNGTNCATGNVGDTGIIRVWDLDKKKCVHRIETGRQFVLQCLAITPDGGRLFVAERKQVTIWDTASRKIVRHIKVLGNVTAITLSPDGKYLAVALSHGETTDPTTVALFDITTWRRIGAFPGPLGRASHLTFSHDNKWLAIAPAFPDYAVLLQQTSITNK